jgi:hypothetical protein
MTPTRLQAHAEANAALTRALLNAAARGQRPRCGDAEVSDYWLSEADHERALAATWCTGCVVIAECDEVGRHQTWGVFGGRDYIRRPGRAKPPAE